jgi:class 3 adenylate cyclase/predicted ATPase
MSDIRQWLADLGLERYGDVFEREELTPANLPELTDDELKDLGLPLGPRKTILKAINALLTSDTIAPSRSPDSYTPKHLAEKNLASKNALEGERRQLTVLFCDIVGSTELTNRVDPEILENILRAYEDACAACITRYEGYVFRRVGDGIVAFFGYPLAHEGEAERAIHAGLAIIAALSKLDVSDVDHLAVRIGIASGLVVVSSTEKGAEGEPLNLASRLQAIAQPGSIVVSERVSRLARGSFDYEDMGEQALKGYAQPTRAYRIVGVSEATSRFEAATQERLTPLVGREQEIGLLLDRWALAQDGEGQVVLLSGEPGIGKSRILIALRDRLDAQGAPALRFQCSPYYMNSAFWPSIDNFERALKFGRDESPASKLDKLEALIVTHYGRPLTDVRFIASMLSIPCEERYGAHTMTPQKHKDETLRSLVDLAEAAARKQPSIMLYEDVHWADPTSLEALDLLIDRVRSFPLLIVLTHRPEFHSRWGAHGHVAGLNLSKLMRGQSSTMISKLAGSKALPAELVEQILAKTDGVPLFVEELTKSILESSELKESADRYEYAGTAHSITIPATLRDSLMARLDRYMPVKEIAQIGAAIGREFSYELVAAVAPRAKAELEDALERLAASGLAFRRGTPPEATYTFKHALVQDAAYDSLLKSRRQELHRKIARVIEERFPNIKTTEPEVLAHHLTAAHLADAAVPLWRAAGELSMRRMALTEAVSHLTRGLEVISTLPPSSERDASELELRTLLGAVLIATRGFASPEVEQSYGRARVLCRQMRDTPQIFPVLFGLWAFYLVRADLPATRELVDQLWQLARSAQESTLLSVAHRAMATTFHFLGQFVLAQEHEAQGTALYDPQEHSSLALLYGEHPAVVCQCFAAHDLWYLGYPDRALVSIQDALTLAQQLAHPFMLVHTLDFAAWLHLYRREGQLTREQAEADIALATEHKIAFFLAHGTIFRGWALVEQGRRTEGIAQIRQGLAAYRATGAECERPYLLALLAEAYGKVGQPEEGLLVLEEALAGVRKGWRCCEAELYRLKGELLLEVSAESKAEAEACFRQALDIARHQQARSLELRAAVSLSRLWQGQGKRAAAHELLLAIYDWFSEGFETTDLREAKVLLEALA